MKRNGATAIVYLLAAVADSWLLLAGRPINQSSDIESALSALAAVLFALAAGLMWRKPKFAHAFAAAGVATLPWLYTAFLHGNVYTNEWIIFNVPDRELGFYNGLANTELTLLAVALIVFGVGTGILRFLPNRWVLRNIPIRERTWPAVAACLLSFAVWFSQSVMPYRIPGAVTHGYSGTALQILHVEKHGAQFHETCFKVWGRRRSPEFVTISSNDRRLFKYRFLERFAQAEVPQSLRTRITTLIQSATARSNRDSIQPLRRWDDEGWYVEGEGGLISYTKENGSTPPQEILDMFRDLEALPRNDEAPELQKDVCLGFCYDPLSALGALYANDRCRYEGSHFVCR